MSHVDLVNMPPDFTAGTTLTYLRPATSQFDTSWTLTAIIAGKEVDQVKAIDEGGAFRVTFKASRTGILPPGRYEWVHRMSKAGVVHDLEGGEVIVAPDLSDADPGDRQAFAEKMLPLIELALMNRVPSGLQNYQVSTGSGMRAVGKMTIPELETMRGQYQTEVTMIRNPKKVSRAIRLTFPAAK